RARHRNNPRARLCINGYSGLKKCIAFMQDNNGMAPQNMSDENSDKDDELGEYEETGTSEDDEDNESGIEDEEDCSQEYGPTAATRYAVRRRSLPQPVTPLMLTYGQQQTAGQQPSQPQPHSPLEETLCRILLDAAKVAAKTAAHDANEAVQAAREREQQQEAQVAVEALAACKDQVAKLQAREQEQQQEAQVARKALLAYKQQVVQLQEIRRAMLRAGGASDLDLL
ncbi:hypothetical protein V8C86DRAFT_2443421, partial [Haematococcus lacustris]